MRSKASNGYDAAVMAAVAAELAACAVAVDGEIVSAFRDDALVGFMHLRIASREAEIEALFVEPTEQRGGIGRALWMAAEERARAAGARSMGADADPQAVGFYTAMGCAPAGETPSAAIPGRMLARMEKALG